MTSTLTRLSAAILPHGAAVLLSLLPLAAARTVTAAPAAERAACAGHSGRVTITRDEWGVPHVRGRTDADAVFGLIYAQAEDDFQRIEMNYLNALGRTAEVEGETKLYEDLRMRLVVDEAALRERYAASPSWLRQLMQAWADGLNCFLATQPQVRPQVLARFEPWMPLAFSEGSIGWDIENVDVADLQRFYGDGTGPASRAAQSVPGLRDPDGQGGSNGIAIAPRLTRARHSLLLINPHTSFYFRSEAHVRSDEGLHAYGAVTWGQFFVYQGFNERLGWMHTSTGADFMDEYAETVTRTPGGGATYLHAGRQLPVTARAATLRYRTAAGMAEKRFDLLFTRHGPVVREEQGKWIAVRLMH
ncbi:MAG: penicillin acylase family protein, partial [Steroidobacteraceae bacterium]